MSLPPLYWYPIFQALVLLIAANGAPVITNKVLGNHLAKPMDNGLILADGYPLFGSRKTWRGLFSAVFFATVVAILFGAFLLAGVQLYLAEEALPALTAGGLAAICLIYVLVKR